MKFIADLHIHSHYSLATSKELTPEYLDYWARIKGIQVIGTGDFSHPKWLKELTEKLIPAEEGLYKIKPNLQLNLKNTGFNPSFDATRFILTAEISNIYKKNGKTRKVHNILLAPDFKSVQHLQKKLTQQNFNISSDGRPILGMDSRDLLELCLTISDKIMLIPAHIWTPWFSAMGQKSGFDSIEECYADMAKYIYAVEMGLSSDPPMNWLVPSLDKYTLLANSDAHSPEKLGRNATIFNTNLSYNSITNAIKSGDNKTCLGTINFFPQEGKYHYDGHRKCNICFNPLQTLLHEGKCPVCKKQLTIGVLNRVAELAGRDNILTRPNRHPFYSLIPLKELLAEIFQVSENSKKVKSEYTEIIKKCGTEFNLLLDMPISEIQSTTSCLFAEAIRRMRNREIYIQEGFDGEYGKITVFSPDELKILKTNKTLPPEKYKPASTQELICFDITQFCEKKNLCGKKKYTQTQLNLF